MHHHSEWNPLHRKVQWCSQCWCFFFFEYLSAQFSSYERSTLMNDCFCRLAESNYRSAAKSTVLNELIDNLSLFILWRSFHWLKTVSLQIFHKSTFESRLRWERDLPVSPDLLFIEFIKLQLQSISETGIFRLGQLSLELAYQSEIQ